MKCDVCNSEMKMQQKVKIFRCRQEKFHASALCWRCTSCGFEKIATCNVKLWANDVMDNGEPTERTEEEIRREKPTMWKKGKEKTINFQWLDYMFKNHKSFQLIYRAVVPYAERQKYEISKVVPEHQAIVNDKLYNTEYAEMFYKKDYIQNDGTIFRNFYYKTADSEFFHVTYSTDGLKDFSVDEESDIKRLLSSKPDIYMKVIKGVVYASKPADETEEEEDETISTAKGDLTEEKKPENE